MQIQQQQQPQNQQNINTERIMVEPKIVTQRIMQKPKIITERITTEPRIVTNQVIEPTRQRIVIEPKINKTIEVLKPQYNKQKDQFVNNDPIYQDTKYQYETRKEIVNVPGDIVNNNFIVEPSVKTIRQNVQFQPSQEVRKTLPVINRVPEIQNNVETLKYTIPADQYITQPYVQQINQKETVKVNWEQEPDRVTELDPITREPIYQSRSRVQNVSVPGNIFYRQNVTQPIVNREEVEVRFNQPAPITRTNQPIVQPVVRSHDKKVIRNVVPYHVKDEIPVGVPTPVVYDVPVYNYQYVPVEEPAECNDCDPLGGIEAIINKSEVVIHKGNGDVVNSDYNGERRRRRDDSSSEEMEFEQAVKHFKGLYGDDTFNGDIRYFDFERENQYPQINKLKRKVLRQKKQIMEKEKEEQRLAYIDSVYGDRNKRQNKIFGEDPDDPIFENAEYYYSCKGSSKKYKSYHGKRYC